MKSLSPAIRALRAQGEHPPSNAFTAIRRSQKGNLHTTRHVGVPRRRRACTRLPCSKAMEVLLLSRSNNEAPWRP